MTRQASLGDEIRDARVAKGLGLRALARLIEIAPSYLSDIEYNRRLPSEEVLRNICRHLELDVDRMLALAGRFGDGADEYLKQAPNAGVLFRRAQEHNLTDEDLRKLIQQADRMAQRKREKDSS